jgi:uncharacterized RDD family membrane protein YckC
VSSYPYPPTGTTYAPAPPAGDPTAVMGRRVGAFVVDSVIVLAPAVGLFTSDLEYLEEDDLDQSGTDFCDDYMDQEDGVCVDAGDRVYFSDGVPVAPWLVALGVGLLIAVLLQGLKGWTPGKLLFGLRNVGEDGQPPGIGRALIRWVLFIVDGLCVGLVGLIVALSNKGHRRVGDMAASTYVVGKEYAGSPIVVPGVTPAYPGAYPGYPGAPGAPGEAGGPGASWGPPPGDQPPSWGQPPTWGPPPTWGAPPTEPPPASTPAPPVGSPAAWSPPGGEPAPTDEATPAEATPAEPAETQPTPEPAAPEPQGLLGTPAAEEPESPAESPPSDQPSSAAEAPATTPEESQPEASAAAQSGYNPQWDPARGTYIVWSPERGQWLGWDDAAKEWKPL